MSDDRIHLFDGFTLDLTRGFLLRGDELVHLRPQTYEVLQYLVENRGRLISKDKLIEDVWHGRAVTDGSLGKCIEEVREALGDNAMTYVRNVRGRGYIFDPAANGSEKIEATSEQIDVLRVVVVDEEKEGGTVYLVDQIRKHKLSFAVALSVLLLAAGGLGYWFFAARSSKSAPIESIAVLPFKNESGNPEVEYLSDGMTESLINSLSQLPRLSVKARSSVFHYKGKEVDPRRIAAELNVQAILNGRLVQHGDDLTLYLSLVDARNGNQLWGEQYNRKLTDLVSLQSEIAREVSEKLRLRLTSTEQQRVTKRGTENTEAYRAYLKGRYYWSNPRAPGYEKSLDYFRQAIDLDPTYALGYAGLSNYYGFASATGLLPPNENWPRAEAAANKALALDDTLADAYNAMAGIKLYYYRDWPAAEHYFRRGIELNPNAAELHHHYSRCLVLFGRDEEALAEMQRAVELDPLALFYNLNWGRLFFFIHQYDRAIDQLRKTLELDQNYAAAHEWLGYAYEKKGIKREAINEWSTALTLNEAGAHASALERSYAASGFEAAVRALAQQRLENLNERIKRAEYVPAGEYVTAYTRLGDKEQALAWLDKAVQERNRLAFEFKVNPIYDKLRDDPRFGRLLERMNLSRVTSAGKN